MPEVNNQGIKVYPWDSVVIHLPQRPQRLTTFKERCASNNIDIEVLLGTDGQRLDPNELYQRGLISSSALQWPRGQLGCALSHLRCIMRCMQRNRPLLVFEDDALLAENWLHTLDKLFHAAPPQWDILLLGWNLDSCIQMEWQAGLSFTSLFQPRFPSERRLQNALNQTTKRQWFRLHNALGLAGYLVSPAGAARIVEWALPLRALPIQVPELPERLCFSFDGQLNSLYPRLSAWACVPPLVMGANDKANSLTSR